MASQASGQEMSRAIPAWWVQPVLPRRRTLRPEESEPEAARIGKTPSSAVSTSRVWERRTGTTRIVRPIQ